MSTRSHGLQRRCSHCSAGTTRQLILLSRYENACCFCTAFHVRAGILKTLLPCKHITCADRMMLDPYHILVTIPHAIFKEGETMHCAPIVVIGPCRIGRFPFILQTEQGHNVTVAMQAGSSRGGALGAPNRWRACKVGKQERHP